jgi:hypothetical protein
VHGFGLELDGDAGEARGDAGDVRTLGKIEDAGAEGHGLETQAEMGEAELDGFGKLEFAARRTRNELAGAENRGIEAPAVHADEDFAAGGSFGDGFGLFDDFFEVSIGGDLQQSVAKDAVARDIAFANEAFPFEDRKARLTEFAEGAEDFDGIVVVRIEHEERIGGDEGLRGEEGVGGADGLLLNGEADADAAQGQRSVIAAHGGVFGADDEADVAQAGVGERAENEIEKGPSHGDHGLHSGIGGAGLLGSEGGGLIRSSHALAETASENHSFIHSELSAAKIFISCCAKESSLAERGERHYPTAALKQQAGKHAPRVD